MENLTVKNLHFKWTISKGQNTYGYNICTLYVDGVKVSKCIGGGYDMQGTCLANWLAKSYENSLIELSLKSILNAGIKHASELPSQYCKGSELIKYTNDLKDGNNRSLYGFTYYFNLTTNKCFIGLDGACGFSSIQYIGEAIGIKLQWNKASDRYKNSTFYTAMIDNLFVI